MPTKTRREKLPPEKALLRVSTTLPAYLDLSRNGTRQVIERGELPVIRIGKRAKAVSKADADAWIAKRRNGGA